jgi:hypothetical protein
VALVTTLRMAALAASLVTTLSSQYGNGYFRFVARARSAHLRWPSYAMAGATFPAARPSLEDVATQGAWLETQRERFQELHQQLLALRAGGRPATGGRTWTGTPRPTPTNGPRGAHDAGAPGTRCVAARVRRCAGFDR